MRYRFGGLIFGGAYIWRGLFSEFYGMSIHFRTTYLKGFILYMLDVHVDAVKVTTVCVSDYDGVHTNKPHNRL